MSDLSFSILLLWQSFNTVANNLCSRKSNFHVWHELLKTIFVLKFLLPALFLTTTLSPTIWNTVSFMGTDDAGFLLKHMTFCHFIVTNCPRSHIGSWDKRTVKDIESLEKNLLQMSLRYMNSEKKGRSVGGSHRQKEGRQEGEGMGKKKAVGERKTNWRLWS